MTDAILPTAGSATRMRGLPKFLLPAGPDHVTLIEKHVLALADHCETIWIPTRPEQAVLLATLGFSSDQVVVVPMKTATMTETVLRIAKISGAENFVMTMPDTFFSGEQPYSFLASGRGMMNLACWRIREDQRGKLGQVKLASEPEGVILESVDKDPTCTYTHSWGAMSFTRSILEYADPSMPHTGYMISKLLHSSVPVLGREMQGSYYDCGTPEEYIQMLTKDSQIS